MVRLAVMRFVSLTRSKVVKEIILVLGREYKATAGWTKWLRSKMKIDTGGRDEKNGIFVHRKKS